MWFEKSLADHGILSWNSRAFVDIKWRSSAVAVVLGLSLQSLASAQETPPDDAALASTQNTDAENDAELLRLQSQNQDLARRVEQLEARSVETPSSVAPLPAPAPASTSAASAVASTTVEPLLSPSILLEADYRTYPSSIEGQDGFAIARFRPGLALTPNSWFRAVASMEFATATPIILDAYARFQAERWLEFTLGYSKPPLFASFVNEPVHTMPFTDRAPVVNSFRVRRDVGADVHFKPSRVPLEGWLRIGNGSGSVLGNDNSVPAGYGALDLVLGRGRLGATAQQHRYGLRLGVAGLVEKVAQRNGIQGQTPFMFVYYQPAVIEGLRTVGEGHLVLYAASLRFTTEAALARESRSSDGDDDPTTAPTKLDAMLSYGITSELAWVILGGAREVGRAPAPATNVNGTWAGGAVEVALRYDGMWLGHGADDVSSGGSQGGAAALKWWPTRFLAATLTGFAAHYNEAPMEEPSRFWTYGVSARISVYWGLSGQPRDEPRAEAR